MADIRRQIGDVSPNNYIRPGVQDNSASTILAGLAQGGMQIDVAIAQDNLNEELEGLRTQYLVGSPAAIATQDDAPLLTEADKKEVSELGNKLKRFEAARDQGRMTYDAYRLRGERLLRQAIAKRPGLAQEFRQQAAMTLGVDVVGTSVDILASAERGMEAQAKKAAEAQDEAVKGMRKELFDLGGMLTQNLTDAQVIDLYQQNIDSMTAVKRSMVTSESAKALAATQQAGQELRRPRSTLDFVDAAQSKKSELYKQANQVAFALNSPEVPLDQKAQILTGSRASVQQAISEMNALAAAGDVDPAIAEREITSLTTLGKMLDELVTGTTGTEINMAKVKGIQAFTQHALMSSSDEAPFLASFVDLFGPEAFAQFYGPTGQFNKQLPEAMAKAMANTGTPSVTAGSASDGISALVKTHIGPEAAKSSTYQEGKQTFSDYVGKALEAFVILPDQQFRMGQFNGPSGAAAKLYLHREALTKELSPEQAATVATRLAAATYNAQRVMTASLFQKYPSLRGKVAVEFDPETGKLYWPLESNAEGQPVSLTAFERQALAMYNQEFGGDRLVTTIAQIGYGGTAAEQRQKAVELVYQYGGFVDEARKAAQSRSAASQAPSMGGTTAPTRQRPSTSRSGPPVGTVEGGYRFKGGDPGNMASWEPV